MSHMENFKVTKRHKVRERGQREIHGKERGRGGEQKVQMMGGL
jgi:hypothetical protein